jgi:bifunctional NMN adenylyltransferase/nudix hydrolase
MSKKYKVAVVMGRFEPAHNAHFALYEKGLEVADDIIILLGSHNSPRTIKNPWTSREREEMIRSGFSDQQNENIFFARVEDNIYSDPDWIVNAYHSIDMTIAHMFEQPFIPSDDFVTIIAHDKDVTSYYLNYFKERWKITEVPCITASDSGPALSSTKVRELYFDGYMDLIGAICPAGVTKYLAEFRETDMFKSLKQEYDDAIKYDAQYENVPYGQTNFLTSDAMVVQSGRVLLVQRGKSPGKGLWALPGGHVNVNETFYQAAVRELKEETSIKVPDKVLHGSFVYERVFDHPDRSLRGRLRKKIGRTVTRLHVFKLDDAADRPNVKAADDAAKAWWFTFAELKAMRDCMFEDHYDMIMDGLKRI